MHVCFGNYGGQSVQKGFWKDLMPFFNRPEGRITWCWSSRAAATTNWKPSAISIRAIGLGLGVIDIKDNEIESPELIARRIENAAKVLGPGRVRYIHPDCGFWMLQRSVADGKMRALVAGRNLFEGRP